MVFVSKSCVHFSTLRQQTTTRDRSHVLVQIHTTQQENSIQPRGVSVSVKNTEPTQMIVTVRKNLDSPTNTQQSKTVIAYHLDVTDSSDAAHE